jgi:hypothetical protein
VFAPLRLLRDKQRRWQHHQKGPPSKAAGTGGNSSFDGHDLILYNTVSLSR